MSSNHVTLLHCRPGHRATKVIRRAPDGSIKILGYNAGFLFAVEVVEVRGIEDLAEQLRGLVSKPRAFLIRAELLPEADPYCARRLLHAHHENDGTVTPATFRDVPRSWVVLDFDSVLAPKAVDPCDGRAAANHCLRLLPQPWRTATCFWALSASAGFKQNIRIKIVFWLDRPMLGAELQRHLAGAPIDPSTLRAVQPTYIAAPILGAGITDPAPVRCGLLQGGNDGVRLPVLPPAPPRTFVPTHSPNGSRYMSGLPSAAAERRLAGLCSVIEHAPVGGRHHALVWAASRAIEIDDAISRGIIGAKLIAAARRAGLEDPHAELVRHVRNGFRRGIFGNGGHA